jgi:hypothetical protein
LELASFEARAEAEHDRAVLEVTNNYRAQMPAVKDAIWEAAWQRCLTKLGIDKTSPYWLNMELPSEVVPVQEPADDDQPELPQDQLQTDGTVTDLTIHRDDAPEGDNPDPPSATDAPLLSEEADA